MLKYGKYYSNTHSCTPVSSFPSFNVQCLQLRGLDFTGHQLNEEPHITLTWANQNKDGC